MRGVSSGDKAPREVEAASQIAGQIPALRCGGSLITPLRHVDHHAEFHLLGRRLPMPFGGRSGRPSGSRDSLLLHQLDVSAARQNPIAPLVIGERRFQPILYRVREL
jgi:hypothetical protein